MWSETTSKYCTRREALPKGSVDNLLYLAVYSLEDKYGTGPPYSTCTPIVCPLTQQEYNLYMYTVYV